MSYKTEVRVNGQWSGNALRFATISEADEYGKELLSRWYVPDAHRVVGSDDAVNEVFDFEDYRAKPVEGGK